MTRASLAAETVRIVDAGKYRLPDGRVVDIAAAVEACVRGTRQFDPERLRRIRDEALAQAGPSFDTAIEVVNETTLAGASELCRASAGRRVGVLNFASARNPGGGFLGGAEAQEESLARSSALYKSQRQCPEFYAYHRAHASLLYSHRAIYSPGCPVFRDDAGDLLPTPYQVDFITCPAPNAGAVSRNQPEDVPRIAPVLRERAALVLGLALHCGAAELVLGAWGCGVFRNDPAVVAGAFREALQSDGLFAGRFRRVRFSMLDRSRDGATLRAFTEAFPPARQ